MSMGFIRSVKHTMASRMKLMIKPRVSARWVIVVTVLLSLSATTLTLAALDVPPDIDPKLFFTMLESFNEENDTTADAYYAAVDPNNERTTFADWLVVNGFINNTGEFSADGHSPGDTVVRANSDAFALYVNDVDLGFTRRFVIRTDDDGNVASYVENYPSLEAAKARLGVLAIVTMEWRAAADGSNPDEKFTTFYTYGGDAARSRINAADLTIGFGQSGNVVDLGVAEAKAQPGLCIVCHGGKPKALNADGTYPDNGDTGAMFLPWDVDAFLFDSDNPADPLSRAAQEPEFKKFNEAVLTTWPTEEKFDEVAGFSRLPATVELIHGWYGGPGLPNDTFDEGFIPAGWLPPLAPEGADELYSEVLARNCRACHAQQETSLDFATYAGFAVFKDATEELVFGVLDGADDDPRDRPGDDQAVMPLVKLTYENFWTSDAPDILREHLDQIEED